MLREWVCGDRKNSITCLFTKTAHSTIWHAVMYIGRVGLAVTRRTWNAKCLQYIPCRSYPRSFSITFDNYSKLKQRNSDLVQTHIIFCLCFLFHQRNAFYKKNFCFWTAYWHIQKLLRFICKFATPCSTNFDNYSWSQRGPYNRTAIGCKWQM
jgi:hypothetical protein